jgi:hypothetical protein
MKRLRGMCWRATSAKMIYLNVVSNKSGKYVGAILRVTSTVWQTFNSLANQLGIHIILAKQEKLASNSLANQLSKNRSLAKLTSPHAYMRARIVVVIVVSL